MAKKRKILAAGPTAPIPPPPDVVEWFKKELREWLKAEPKEPAKIREELDAKLDEIYKKYWEKERQKRREGMWLKKEKH